MKKYPPPAKTAGISAGQGRPAMALNSTQSRRILQAAAGFSALAGLYAVSRYNYLLFHGLAELFAVAVAWSVFFLLWNTRRLEQNDALLLLGIAYFFVGFIDLVHTLSYKGMGIFVDDLAANHATQLWIAARGVEAVSLLLFPLLLGRRIRAWPVFCAYTGITALLLAAIFAWNLFPACYIEGVGLTGFKVGAEYVIVLLLALAIGLLFKRRELMDAAVWRLVIAAMAVTIAEELAFTLYTDVYGLSNLIGHLLKIVSFFLIYLALVRSSIARPFETMFQTLSRDKERLQEAEETYRGIFLNSQIGLFRTDVRTGELLDANDAVARFLGYPNRGELLAEPFSIAERYVDPEDRRKMVSMLESQGEFQNFEARFRRNDGSILWMRYSARLVPEKGWIEGVSEDVTERKQTEENLRLQALVLDQISDRVTVTDLKGVITYVNEAEVKALGYSRDELIGVSTEKFGEDRERGAIQREIIEKTLSEGRWRGEVVNFAADGSEIVMDCRTRVVRDTDGTPLALSGIATDITERRRVDADRERLTTAIEQAGEAVVITDKKGIIQYINPAFERITGYAREEVLGQNPRILKSGQQDQVFYQTLWGIILRGDTWRGKMVNKKKNGTLYTEEAVISPVTDTQGRIAHFVAVKKDVTRELALKNQLHQAQKVESIGRLAGGVAHDLNNLLSPILGYAEMLREDLAAEDTKLESVDEILNAGMKARDLVRQLLAFSRKQTLELKRIEINTVLKNFRKLLRRTIREDIAIKYNLEPAPLPVMADVNQMEQVIMNLAVNAADAMPTGGFLTIETARAALDEEYAGMRPGVKPGDYLLLAVSDTGCGMDDYTRENIFEPFFSTKGEQGTGLGLATVYGIIKQHNGNIWVYSEPDKGTTFKVYLPLAGDADVPSKALTKPTKNLKGSEWVLLVEDDDQVRHLANAILNRQGYRVILAKGGTEAIKALEQHDGPLHLLLTDVVMPGMNGKELFEKLSKGYPDLKVLYMSGYTTNVIAHRGILDEGIQLIQKPFAVKALAAKVREVLDQG